MCVYVCVYVCVCVCVCVCVRVCVGRKIHFFYSGFNGLSGCLGQKNHMFCCVLVGALRVEIRAGIFGRDYIGDSERSFSSFSSTPPCPTGDVQVGPRWAARGVVVFWVHSSLHMCSSKLLVFLCL